MSRQTEASDGIDTRRTQWQRELPDADTSPMGVIGRARRITLLTRPSIEAVFARHGIDTGEFDVLSTLLRAGPPYRLRPTELYQSLMISSGGLSGRLARLTKLGLISRPQSEGDGRSLPVELTTVGRQRAEAAFLEDMAVEAELLGSLGEEDRMTLEVLLRRLLVKLENADDRQAGSKQL